MIDRRSAILAGGAAILAGCTKFNTETGEAVSCDIVTYPLNTGVDYLQSTIGNTVFVDDGGRQAKWRFNNQGSDPSGSHDAAPIVLDGAFNGKQPLGNSKWIKGTEDNLGGGELFLFTYCFCVDDSPVGDIPLNQKFGIKNLDVLSSHHLHRVWLDGVPFPLFEGAPGEDRFTYDSQNSGHAEYNDFIKEGLNCLNITVMTPTRAIEPMGISVTGLISGISCCAG